MDSYSHFLHVKHILGLKIILNTSFDSEDILWEMLGKPLPRINGSAARKGSRMAHHGMPLQRAHKIRKEHEFPSQDIHNLLKPL